MKSILDMVFSLPEIKEGKLGVHEKTLEAERRANKEKITAKRLAPIHIQKKYREFSAPGRTGRKI